MHEQDSKEEIQPHQREEARSTIGQKAHSQRGTEDEAAPQTECGSEA
jgi:hypothetical protein